MRALPRTFLAFVAGALIALLTIFALMNVTGLGRRTTARLGFWTAGQLTGFNLACGGFTGNLFSAFICRDFAVSDRQGVFLTGRELEVDWRIAPLFSRRLSVDLLRVTDAVMVREPEGGGDDQEFQLLPDWPNAKIELARINLERFILRFPEKPEICFGGGGGIIVAEPVIAIDTAFARCGGEGIIRALANYRDRQLTIDTRAVDDGAVANFLFGWAGAGASELRIAGNGALESFAGTFDATVADGGEAAFRLNTAPVGQGGAIGLSATGSIVLAEGRAPAWAPARDGELSLRLVVSQGGGVRVDEGMLRWGPSQVSFQFEVEEDSERLTGQIDATLGRIAATLGFDSAQATAVLQGTADSPAAQLTYNMRGMRLDDFTAAGVEGRATMAAENGFERVRFASQGTANTLRIEEFIDAAIGATTSFDISGTYVPADDALDVMGSADGEHVALTFNADLGLGNGASGEVDAEMRVAEAGEIAGIHIPGGSTFVAATEIDENGVAGTLTLESPTLAASGTFARARDGILEGEFVTTRADPVLLSRAINLQFTGVPSLRLAVAGRLTEPVLDFDLTAPAMSRGFFSLTGARAQMRIQKSMALWNGETTLMSASNAGPLALQASLVWGGGGPVRITLRDTSLAGAAVTGEAMAARWRGPWEGVIALRERPLAPIAALLGREMTGNGTIDIALIAEGEAQRVDAALALTQVRSGTALVGATVNGSVGHNVSTGGIEADLSVMDRDDNLRFAADGVIGEETLVTLRTLEGRWTDLPIRLTAPAVLRGGGGRLVLAPAVLDVAGGRLELEGQRMAETLTARATLSALPVAPVAVLFDWPAEAEGRIDGNAEVTFAPMTAQGRVVLAVNDLAFAGEARGLEPADVSLAADWNGRVLSVNGRITGLDSAPAELTATLPLVREPGSYAVDIPERGPVTGSFTAVARAERLFALLPLAEHRLTGALSVSLAVSGDISNPNIGGRAMLADGTYESLELGTRLQNLHLALEATPDGALALNANASDGGAGTFSLNGRVALAGARATVDALLETVNADLARTDEYVARGSANIRIVRGAEGPIRATGTAQTTEVRFDLGRPLPPGVEEIAVIEVNRPPDLVLFAADQGPELLRTAELSIDIDMPGRVFVTGYGIDAEWRGNVDVRGTLGDPLIQGQLTLVRGQAEVLGREFELEQGFVTIDPFAPGNARIRIIGAYRQQGFTVRVTAEGTPAAPRLEWSSTPALPRDEILARLYFGRASPSLSAYEAVQLAQLSGVIAGFGASGGVLGFARRLVGVDVLRLDAPLAGTQGGPRIAVGKYITDRIYVGAVTGADTSSGALQVEVQITPSISVQVETGADAKNAAGVTWERDY